MPGGRLFLSDLCGIRDRRSGCLCCRSCCGLIVAAAWFADPAPIAPEPASKVWGAIHGVFLLLGTVAVMLGFIGGRDVPGASATAEAQACRAGGLRLPSLEWLERINSRVVLFSAIMVASAFSAGIVLNRGRAAGRRCRGPTRWFGVRPDARLAAGGRGVQRVLSAGTAGTQSGLPDRRQLRVPGDFAGTLLLVDARTRRPASERKRGDCGPGVRNHAAANQPRQWRLRASQWPGRPAMKVQMVGCSHHNSAVEVRERLAFGPEQSGRPWTALRERFPDPKPCCFPPATGSKSIRRRRTTRSGPTHEAGGPVLAEFHGLPMVRDFRRSVRAHGRGRRAASVHRGGQPRQHGGRRAADSRPGEAGLRAGHAAQQHRPADARRRFRPRVRVARRVAPKTTSTSDA